MNILIHRLLFNMLPMPSLARISVVGVLAVRMAANDPDPFQEQEEENDTGRGASDVVAPVPPLHLLVKS